MGATTSKSRQRDNSIKIPRYLAQGKWRRERDSPQYAGNPSKCGVFDAIDSPILYQYPVSATRPKSVGQPGVSMSMATSRHVRFPQRRPSSSPSPISAPRSQAKSCRAGPATSGPPAAHPRSHAAAAPDPSDAQAEQTFTGGTYLRAAESVTPRNVQDRRSRLMARLQRQRSARSRRPRRRQDLP